MGTGPYHFQDPSAGHACQPIHEKNFAYYRSREFFREDTIVHMSVPRERDTRWTLLSGHGHVLVEIARNPGARMRDIAPIVDLTERTVQAIVADLIAAGYVNRTRIGRRNHYTVNPAADFRHHAQHGLRVGPFLDVLTASGAAGSHEFARQSRQQAPREKAG